MDDFTHRDVPRLGRRLFRLGPTGPRSATGIFYHPSYSRRSYLTVGTRLATYLIPPVIERLAGL